MRRMKQQHLYKEQLSARVGEMNSNSTAAIMLDKRDDLFVVLSLSRSLSRLVLSSLLVRLSCADCRCWPNHNTRLCFANTWNLVERAALGASWLIHGCHRQPRLRAEISAALGNFVNPMTRRDFTRVFKIPQYWEKVHYFMFVKVFDWFRKLI